MRALAAHKITTTELDNLLTRDGIKTILIDYGNGQEPAIYDDDLAAYVADRDITPEKFKHLRGTLLGLSEAGLKYGINPTTVARWARDGHLEIKGEDGLKKLVDEAEVAYLAKSGRAKNMRPGKKPFYKSRAEVEVKTDI